MHNRRGESHAWLAPFLFLAFAAGIFACARRRFGRYAVAGTSMRPALREGDWLIVDLHAYSRRLPGRGEVVVARDPRDPARPILKRVAYTGSEGACWLLGDNPPESTDSRAFGPVASAAIDGRVLWRYWPPGRFGRIAPRRM